MRTDRSGVAGFFEDLPVLMFVLSGVASLVLTSVFVSERIASAELGEQLDAIADRMVSSVSLEILRSCGADTVPSLAAVRSVNYSFLTAESCEGRSFALSVLSLHPSFSCLVNISCNRTGVPSSTGYASGLLNALADDGLVMVMEVRAIVW